MSRAVYGILALIFVIGSSLTFVPLYGGSNPPATPEPAVRLQTVKYAELIQAVKSHRGKVVVVDVWAEW